jgi:hypothetical protein
MGIEAEGAAGSPYAASLGRGLQLNPVRQGQQRMPIRLRRRLQTQFDKTYGLDRMRPGQEMPMEPGKPRRGNAVVGTGNGDGYRQRKL